MASITSRRAFVIRGVAMLAVAEMLWMTWSSVRHGIWVDIDVYAMGGRIAREGGDLYSALTVEKLPFTYSPFAALLFVPLSLLHTDAGRLVFTLVSLACYAAIVAVISRRLHLQMWLALVLGGLGLALEPMLRNLLLGQVNLILVALVVVDWLLLPRRYRGFLTGIAAGIKITPAAFIVIAILRRDWAVLVRSGLGFLASAALGWLAAPSSSKIFWGGGFVGLEKFGGEAVLRSDNQSLLGAWMRATGTIAPSETVRLAALVFGMALGTAAAFIELRRARPDSEVAAVSWVALGALLGSPISWSHHWVWLILPLGLLLARRRYITFALTSAISWYPTIWINPPGDYGELLLATPQRIQSCAYVIVGVALLVVALTKSTAARPGSLASEPLPRAENAAVPFPPSVAQTAEPLVALRGSPGSDA
ncbi:glycosyltransferase 87 family protein [Terrabacter sp. 2RAF25]|uniref:glycosyltransferase 87 family protein n=1 Tax=Terrabacter sp. 2RAF25 TaxID=3232998 RepID=UPI003F9B0000